MKTRKIISIFASLALAASLMLSGCNNSGSSSASSDASEGQSSVSSDASGSDGQDTSSGDTSGSEGGENKTTEDDIKKMTSLEVVRDMGNGINLGNTMEAYAHKSYLSGADPVQAQYVWGQPETNAEMVKGMKDAGFDVLRVPVAWTNGMNFESGDYTIDERLMNRVDEIVNYALDADMYVIINDHWDGGWWGMFGSKTQETRDKAMEMYKAMWKQIGEHFKDHSYRLIFESANEELGDRLNDKDLCPDSGSLSIKQRFETLYNINSEFVKTIRAIGGKNEDRFLLIAGYNTDIDHTTDDNYKMPEDTASNKLILSVHYYGPWDYCGTSSVNQWGSPLQYEYMNTELKKLTKFTDNGYGVIIGEYGVLVNGRTPKPDTDIYYENFLNNCDLYNFCPVLWDCNNLFNRSTYVLEDAGIKAFFKERSRAVQLSKYTEEQILQNAKDGMERDLEAANDRMSDEDDIPATDDTAVAWIMYQSDNYGVSYSVGDTYDPTNKTVGIKATNALITGEGTYTVSLDMTGLKAKGTAFSALGIYNGETLFPDYTIKIESFKVNGEEVEVGKGYTSSDNGKCTRMNLYNGWVDSVPDGARSYDGVTSDASAQIWSVGKTELVEKIEITFSFNAPKE